MNFQKIALPAALACALGLVAPGAFAKNDEEATQPIKSFTVLQTPEPVSYTMESRVLGIPGFAMSFRNRAMGKHLTEEMIKALPKLLEAMRGEVVASLKLAGLTEISAPTVKIDPEKPHKVRYKDIKTDADIVINVFFEEVGLMASNSPFEPKMLAKICVVIPKVDDDCMVDEEAVSGYKAEKNREFHFVSDPMTENWGDEDAVFAKIPEVVRAFQSGAKKIANAYAKKIQQANLKTVAPPVPEKVVAPVVEVITPAEVPPVVAPDPIVQKTVTPEKVEKAESPAAKRLRELNQLRSDGLITEREYNEKRKAILSTL